MKKTIPTSESIPDFMLPFPAEQIRAWRHGEKFDWGEGPWLTEPDKVHWIDPETGLDCLLHRNDLGAWCGYVGVPQGHPWHGMHYDAVAVDVHGGLTFSDRCQKTEDPGVGVCHIPAPGRSDHVWWLGFDTAHAFDLVPSLDAWRRRTGLLPRASIAPPEWQDIYRDVAYVAAEVRSLARQAGAAQIRAGL